jgi:hypothetical protein
MLAYHSEAVKEYKNLSLSLIITKDSFFYGILSSGESRRLVEAEGIDLSEVEPFAFEKTCLEYLADKGLINRKFKDVHVSCLDARFTLVHEKLFEYGEEHAYLRNILSERKQHRAKARYINGSRHWCVHTIAGFMENNILSNFPQATFSHALMDLLNLLFNKKNSNGISLFYLEHKLLITAVKNSELQFANYYDIVSNEDVLYHLLHAYKTAGLDPDRDMLWYAGDLDKADPLFKMLYDYIRNLSELQSGTHGPTQQKIFLK